MFDRVTVRGGAGELLWGYRAAATLRSWTITKADKGTWHLSGALDTADRFQCAQAITRKELLFTAPRDKGRWCWRVLHLDMGTNQIRATLGAPLQ